MAGNHRVLNRALGCASYVALHEELDRAYLPSLSPQHWFSFAPSVWLFEGSEHSLLQLFPWTLVDFFAFAALRCLWAALTAWFCLDAIGVRNVYQRVVGPCPLELWHCASGAYAIYLLNTQRHLRGVARVLELAHLEVFDRNVPHEPDSEATWRPALGEWRQTASLKTHLLTLAICLGTVVALIAYEQRNDNWLLPLVQQCRAEAMALGSSKPLFIELISAPTQFEHTVTSSVLNAHKFSPVLQNGLKDTHHMYCYPFQMYYNYDGLGVFEECLRRRGNQGRVWLRSFVDESRTLMNVCVGAIVASAALLATRAFFRQ